MKLILTFKQQDENGTGKYMRIFYHYNYLSLHTPMVTSPVSKMNKLFQPYLVIYLSEAIPESSNVSLERETLEH